MSDTTADSTEEHTEPLATFTPTYYQQLAAEIMEDLDRVAAKFPKLEAHHQVSANDMRAHMNVPIPFLATAVVVTEEAQQLRITQELAPDEGRDTLQYLDAFGVVDAKLNAVKADLRYTLMSRRTRLAMQALLIYAMARWFARSEKGVTMASHVENLRRDLGKRGRPRKK